MGPSLGSNQQPLDVKLVEARPGVVGDVRAIDLPGFLRHFCTAGEIHARTEERMYFYIHVNMYISI